MLKDECYYIFIEDDDDKFVIKITNRIDWVIESIDGNVPYDLEMQRYDKEYFIDDILEELREEYNYVQEINSSEVDDYMI